MTTAPPIQISMIHPIHSYTQTQLRRAVMIATVCECGIFHLLAPPEHA